MTHVVGETIARQRGHPLAAKFRELLLVVGALADQGRPGLARFTQVSGGFGLGER